MALITKYLRFGYPSWATTPSLPSILCLVLWVQASCPYWTVVVDILDDMDYLITLPLFIEYKEYKTNDNRYLFVSHSSVEAKWIYKDFSIESKEYKELQNSVLNGRYKNFDNKDVFNVYGHTPVNNVTSNLYQANIDLGCCYSKEQMLDPRLCALAFPSMKVYTQENIEEV